MIGVDMLSAPQADYRQFTMPNLGDADDLYAREFRRPSEPISIFILGN